MNNSKRVLGAQTVALMTSNRFFADEWPLGRLLLEWRKRHAILG